MPPHVGAARGTPDASMPLRQRTIAKLQLRPGQAVLDAGAGSGASYALLRAGVGDEGLVMGVERDPAAFARARDRVASHGWSNVWQACRAAESIRLPQPADAALFFDVHDLCLAPLAVDNLLSQVRPGGHVAAYGLKYFPWWLAPLNVLPWLRSRSRHAHPGGLGRPWQAVERWCDDFTCVSIEGGMGYVAHGRRKPEAPA